MSGDGSVGAVILAAGASRRHGSPKQLVVVDGRTMLEHAIIVALAADLAPVVAVVPVWLSRPASLASKDLRWVRNPFPERGMSLSLRLGVKALDDRVGAALILLGDQPRIKLATLEAILAARGDRPLVATEANDVLAPPVLVERSHFNLVETLSGDAGLRALLRSTPELVRTVRVTAHPPDMDTPEDLARILGP